MATSFIPIQRGRLTVYGEHKKSWGIPKMMVLDMNSFFASCEQQANPFLRGRPVGVVASMHPGSTLIAASKECKAMGITTGTNVGMAQRIAPKIVLMKSEPEKYRAISRAVYKIICEYSDQVERYSIDECFVDFRNTKLNPIEIGAELKIRIREEVGEWLTCNVGIGENKFMAKLAAELKKPDGLAVIWREQLAEVYKTLKFPDLWGINRGWTKRLAQMNITSPLQMLNYPVQNLISIYGKPGFYIWRRVNGLEDDSVDFEEDAPKSFGHSWVLNFRTTDKARLRPVVLRLAEKAARRMRAAGYSANGLYVGIRLAKHDGIHKVKRLLDPINKGSEYAEYIYKMWENWEFPSEVANIAVGFTDLVVRRNQMVLFDDHQRALTDTLDQINNKYGEFTIRSGLLTNSKDWAPDAIAFNKK